MFFMEVQGPFGYGPHPRHGSYLRFVTSALRCPTPSHVSVFASGWFSRAFFDPGIPDKEQKFEIQK